VCEGPAVSSPSKLSPFAQPFSPRERPEGRSKTRRWAKDDLLGASNAEHAPIVSPATYLDAAQRGQQWPRTSPLAWEPGQTSPEACIAVLLVRASESSSLILVN
jgi:hypothetical protein